MEPVSEAELDLLLYAFNNYYTTAQKCEAWKDEFFPVVTTSFHFVVKLKEDCMRQTLLPTDVKSAKKIALPEMQRELHRCCQELNMTIGEAAVHLGIEDFKAA